MTTNMDAGPLTDEQILDEFERRAMRLRDAAGTPNLDGVRVIEGVRALLSASGTAASDHGYVTALIKRMQDYCDSLAPPMARGLMTEAVRAMLAAVPAAPAQSAEPVAYVPVDPENGPVWRDVMTSTDQDGGRFPLRALFFDSPQPGLNKINVDAERAAFEEWMRGCEGYPYAGQYANLMWKAWQARAASPQATATQPAQTSPYLPCPICKGVEGCDHTVPERARAAQTERALTVARETLEHVRVFLRNGIELGYIAMPTIKCDPALQVPMKVDEALSLLTAAQPASGGDHA